MDLIEKAQAKLAAWLKTISLTVNGKPYSGEAEPRTLLAHFLRDTLETDRHAHGLRRRAVRRMHGGLERHPGEILHGVRRTGGRSEIVTVEGLAQDKRLHPLQEAFWKNDAVECGYCTPGMLMSAYGLLRKDSQPTEEQIKKAISGNLCRCTGYGNIVAAIKEAAANFT